jgi:hypothetical protein
MMQESKNFELCTSAHRRGLQDIRGFRHSACEKDQVSAPLIGAWLDGLDTKGFEVEFDSAIQSVVDRLSE